MWQSCMRASTNHACMRGARASIERGGDWVAHMSHSVFSQRRGGGGAGAHAHGGAVHGECQLVMGLSWALSRLVMVDGMLWGGAP